MFIMAIVVPMPLHNVLAVYIQCITDPINCIIPRLVMPYSSFAPVSLIVRSQPGQSSEKLLSFQSVHREICFNNTVPTRGISKHSALIIHMR